MELLSYLPLTLIGYGIIITNLRLCVSLAIYHLISNLLHAHGIMLINSPPQKELEISGGSQGLEFIKKYETKFYM